MHRTMDDAYSFVEQETRGWSVDVYGCGRTDANGGDSGGLKANWRDSGLGNDGSKGAIEWMREASADAVQQKTSRHPASGCGARCTEAGGHLRRFRELG